MSKFLIGFVIFSRIFSKCNIKYLDNYILSQNFVQTKLELTEQNFIIVFRVK